MDNSHHEKKSKLFALQNKVADFLFWLIVLVLFFVISLFKKQLSNFQHWKAVSVIVLIFELVFFFFCFSKFYGVCSPDRDPRLYDHAFRGRWLGIFISCTLCLVFSLIISVFSLSLYCQKCKVDGLWWPIMLGLIMLVMSFYIAISFWFVIRKMKVGVCFDGVYVFGNGLIPWNEIKAISQDDFEGHIKIVCVASSDHGCLSVQNNQQTREITIKRSLVSVPLEKLFSLLKEYYDGHSKR